MTGRTIFDNIYYMRISRVQNRILSILKKAGEITSDLFESDSGPRISLRYGYYYHIKKMEKQGLIKKIKIKKKIKTYSLTEKGKRMIDIPGVPVRRDDGFSTIIMFDIPESEARKRTIFRRYLIRQGFVQLQGSVLISPNKIDRKIKGLIDEMNIKKYITIVSGKIDYI